jgi:hypothetical protein
MFENPKPETEWDRVSIMDPDKFNILLKGDFTRLAGLVAEGIFRRRFNYKAAKNYLC